MRRGALVELTLDQGVGTLLYLGRHPFYGECVLVIGRTDGGASLEDIGARASSGYVTFFPVKGAIASGSARVVNHLKGAVPEVPTRFRRPGRIERGGEVANWIVENEDSEQVVEELSEAQLDLPIGAIVDEQALRAEIEAGWHPRSSPRSLTVSASASPTDDRSRRTKEVTHFLYFEEEDVAKRVAKAVMRLHLGKVESLPSSDGVNWLVAVTHETAREGVEKRLIEIAEEAGGEYDGYEAEL